MSHDVRTYITHINKLSHLSVLLVLRPVTGSFGNRFGTTSGLMIPLRVQKSGDHQLRLVVEIPLFTRLYTSKRWVFGISEPSTVSSEKKNQNPAIRAP